MRCQRNIAFVTGAVESRIHMILQVGQVVCRQTIVAQVVQQGRKAYICLPVYGFKFEEYRRMLTNHHGMKKENALIDC